MVDRIKKIIEYYQLSPAAFAEQIGINRSNLTHLFSGRNQPSLELAKKILLCFPDIKTEWLIMGVGQMFRSNDERELNIQMQKEKLIQISQSKPDLFTSASKASDLLVENVFEKSETKENIVLDKNEISEEKITPALLTEKSAPPICDKPKENEFPPPHSTVTINKIVFFYSDNSFEVYQPK